MNENQLSREIADLQKRVDEIDEQIAGVAEPLRFALLPQKGQKFREWQTERARWQKLIADLHVQAMEIEEEIDQKWEERNRLRLLEKE